MSTFMVVEKHTTSALSPSSPSSSLCTHDQHCGWKLNGLVSEDDSHGNVFGQLEVDTR